MNTQFESIGHGGNATSVSWLRYQHGGHGARATWQCGYRGGAQCCAVSPLIRTAWCGSRTNIQYHPDPGQLRAYVERCDSPAGRYAGAMNEVYSARKYAEPKQETRRRESRVLRPTCMRRTWTGVALFGSN